MIPLAGCWWCYLVGGSRSRRSSHYTTRNQLWSMACWTLVSVLIVSTSEYVGCMILSLWKDKRQNPFHNRMSSPAPVMAPSPRTRSKAIAFPQRLPETLTRGRGERDPNEDRSLFAQGTVSGIRWPPSIPLPPIMSQLTSRSNWRRLPSSATAWMKILWLACYRYRMAIPWCDGRRRRCNPH